MLVFLLALAVAVTANANPHMGTWKLDEDRSKFAEGAIRFKTAVYELAPGDLIKVTLDGFDKDGLPVHSEWTGKFDGKDYPAKGDPFCDARSYLLIRRENAVGLVCKKDGKYVGTGKMRLSADGKTRTTSTRAFDPAMTSFNNVAVYEKQ